jgi:hypothetical protein
MYLCYIDESGTPDIPGNTSHYVLSGLAIPIEKWKHCDTEINFIKKKYGLEDQEIHTGWLIRKYLEQSKILGFEELDRTERRRQSTVQRNISLLALQKSNNTGLYKQTKKNYVKTAPYMHLTYQERYEFIKEIASAISKWSFARLFAECIDKIHFDPSKTGLSVDEQALEQIISRFEQYLRIYSRNIETKKYGLIIHDNNETVARKHTQLMKNFHKQGTFWTNIENIIETPLFVDSELTVMIQLSDVCCYSIRRYLENNENELFDLIFTRGDRKNNKCVGVRHFTNKSCACEICKSH